MWCVRGPVLSHVRSFRFIDQALRADRESCSVPSLSVRGARAARSEQSGVNHACNKPGEQCLGPVGKGFSQAENHARLEVVTPRVFLNALLVMSRVVRAKGKNQT